MEKKHSFRDLVDDMFEREMKEQDQDGWDDIDEESISDGLDPGFSSWADYYHFIYG